MGETLSPSEIISMIPRTPLQYKHTERCAVLPNRQELLRALPPEGVVCEVGVENGDYSADIIEICRPHKLHLVDSWDEPRYQSGLSNVRKRFSKEITDGRVIINRGRSIEVLHEFPDDYLDWVYIDSDHTYPTTIDELNICHQKVKGTGYIMGHDFCLGNVVKGKIYGVIQACAQFCVQRDWGYRYITIESGGHFSFCLARN